MIHPPTKVYEELQKLITPICDSLFRYFEQENATGFLNLDGREGEVLKFRVGQYPFRTEFHIKPFAAFIHVKTFLEGDLEVYLEELDIICHLNGLSEFVLPKTDTIASAARDTTKIQKWEDFGWQYYGQIHKYLTEKEKAELLNLQAKNPQ